jgi:hypothetical protein
MDFLGMIYNAIYYVIDEYMEIIADTIDKTVVLGDAEGTGLDLQEDFKHFLDSVKSRLYKVFSKVLIGSILAVVLLTAGGSFILSETMLTKLAASFIGKGVATLVSPIRDLARDEQNLDPTVEATEAFVQEALDTEATEMVTDVTVEVLR